MWSRWSGGPGGLRPGPLKCFSAPRHHILAESAPQEARNRDKAEFATKVRKSSLFDLNPKKLKGAFESEFLFQGGPFEPNLDMICRAYLMI